MSKRIISKGGGVGESRVFNDPSAEPVDFLEPLRGLHFNGIPAEDIEEVALRYLRPELSDEHHAALEPVAFVHDRARARVTATDVDKQIAERGDFLGKGTSRVMRLDEGGKAYETFAGEPVNDYYAAPDARRDLADQYVPPGFRPKFVNPAKLSKSGRDPRGFEVVKDENGEPVTHGVSVLAKIPEEKARQRNAHYQRLGNSQLEEVYSRATDPKGKEARYLDPDQMLETARR